jgi:hypothetical protein
MGAGITRSRARLFVVLNRHGVTMGHLLVCLHRVAICRSSHQRAAQLATYLHRLNADEKQQHRYEEELLSHFH